MIINRDLIDGRTIWKGQRVIAYQTSIKGPMSANSGKMVSSDYDHFDATIQGLETALQKLDFYHQILVRDNGARNESFMAGCQTMLIWGDGTPVYDERMEGTYDEAMTFLDDLRSVILRSQRGEDVLPNSVTVVMEIFSPTNPAVPLQRTGLKWGSYDASKLD